MADLDNFKLQDFNPWWINSLLINDDSKIVEFEEQKFRYYHNLYRIFPQNKDAVLILRGPRRIGKTTLLKLIIKKLLLEEKIDKEQIFYFSLEEVVEFGRLSSLLRFMLETGRRRTGKRLFIFLDEISFVREWQRSVKLLADMGGLKNTTLLLTGSSAVDLLFSAEQLPGRRGEVYPHDFSFYPLSFAEFSALVEPKINRRFYQPKDLSRWQRLFSDFLICGGWPEIINKYYQNKYIPEIYYDTFLRWVEGDIYKLGRQGETAFRLLREIVKRESTPVSYYELAKEAEIASHATVNDYLSILEKMFLIIRLEQFNLNQKKIEHKKNKKIYFLDPFIRHAILAKTAGFIDQAFQLSRQEAEKNRPLLTEEVTASVLFKDYPNLSYGRGDKDKEIDFVAWEKGQHAYFEVKYQREVGEGEFLWARKLIGRDRLTVLCQKDYYENKISYLPAEIFLGFKAMGWK